MLPTAKSLLAALEKNGCKGTIVRIDHLHDLQEEMQKLYQSRLISPAIIRKYLNRFQYDYSTKISNAQSIIIIALPQPITLLSFPWRGKNKEIMLPPTYVYTQGENSILEIIKKELSQNHFSFIKATLPLKILAVKSGLSQYGRNNISYIHQLGSFYRLLAFVSDMPTDTDSWGTIQRMDSCNKCSACLNRCPNQCIDITRTLIDASKCLTYLNESSEPFPNWLDSTKHNSWVGCMNCQLACPQNKNRHQIKKINFSESQMEELLQALDFSKLSKPLYHLLVELDLTEYSLDILQRNLKVFLPD